MNKFTVQSQKEGRWELLKNCHPGFESNLGPSTPSNMLPMHLTSTLKNPFIKKPLYIITVSICIIFKLWWLKKSLINVS